MSNNDLTDKKIVQPVMKPRELPTAPIPVENGAVWLDNAGLMVKKVIFEKGIPTKIIDFYRDNGNDILVKHTFEIDPKTAQPNEVSGQPPI